MEVKKASSSGLPILAISFTKHTWIFWVLYKTFQLYLNQTFGKYWFINEGCLLLNFSKFAGRESTYANFIINILKIEKLTFTELIFLVLKETQIISIKLHLSQNKIETINWCIYSVCYIAQFGLSCSQSI